MITERQTGKPMYTHRFQTFWMWRELNIQIYKHYTYKSRCWDSIDTTLHTCLQCLQGWPYEQEHCQVSWRCVKCTVEGRWACSILSASCPIMEMEHQLVPNSLLSDRCRSSFIRSPFFFFKRSLSTRMVAGSTDFEMIVQQTEMCLWSILYSLGLDHQVAQFWSSPYI